MISATNDKLHSDHWFVCEDEQKYKLTRWNELVSISRFSMDFDDFVHFLATAVIDVTIEDF